jgi:2-phospho-L-lactate/phosphoenolpyruvate guanylyltransferase
MTRARWIAVVAIKSRGAVKPRLQVGAMRPAYVLAMARDTVAAVLAADSIRACAVVSGDHDVRAAFAGQKAVWVLPDPGGGLNSAKASGISAARDADPLADIAVLPPDLPALVPDELDHALVLAARVPASFVVDAAGTGTSALFLQPGAPPLCKFGPQSRIAHTALGLVDITDWRMGSLRRDVDTTADLQRAAELGLGPRTAELNATQFGYADRRPQAASV